MPSDVFLAKFRYCDPSGGSTIRKACRQNKIRDGYVRLVVTRGQPFGIQAFLAVAESELSPIGDPNERRLQTLSALCRTLIAANEFVYVE